jgi:hypothetical protein
MLAEIFPVEVILDAFDEMAKSNEAQQPSRRPKPKVILFDIGGVCVSPHLNLNLLAS